MSLKRKRESKEEEEEEEEGKKISLTYEISPDFPSVTNRHCRCWTNIFQHKNPSFYYTSRCEPGFLIYLDKELPLEDGSTLSSLLLDVMPDQKDMTREILSYCNIRVHMRSEGTCVGCDCMEAFLQESNYFDVVSTTLPTSKELFLFVAANRHTGSYLYVPSLEDHVEEEGERKKGGNAKYPSMQMPPPLVHKIEDIDVDRIRTRDAEVYMLMNALWDIIRPDCTRDHGRQYQHTSTITIFTDSDYLHKLRHDRQRIKDMLYHDNEFEHSIHQDVLKYIDAFTTCHWKYFPRGGEEEEEEGGKQKVIASLSAQVKRAIQSK